MTKKYKTGEDTTLQKQVLKKEKFKEGWSSKEIVLMLQREAWWVPGAERDGGQG